MNDFDLYEKLSALQGLLHRHHLMSHAAHGPLADPSRGQGRVLAMLKIQPEISTKDLSYLLGIKIASLNELLSKLEKGGYLVRKPSESDKRVMLIHLTEKGKKEQLPKADYSEIFDCLDDAERNTFGAYLDRVIDALEAQVGCAPGEDELAHWMRAARSRMGDEMFAQMMSRRGAFGGGRWGSFPEGRPGAEQFHARPHPAHHALRPGPDGFRRGPNDSTHRSRHPHQAFEDQDDNE